MRSLFVLIQSILLCPDPYIPTGSTSTHDSRRLNKDGGTYGRSDTTSYPCYPQRTKCPNNHGTKINPQQLIPFTHPPFYDASNNMLCRATNTIRYLSLPKTQLSSNLAHHLRYNKILTNSSQRRIDGYPRRWQKTGAPSLGTTHTESHGIDDQVTHHGRP